MYILHMHVYIQYVMHGHVHFLYRVKPVHIGIQCTLQPGVTNVRNIPFTPYKSSS